MLLVFLILFTVAGAQPLTLGDDGATGGSKIAVSDFRNDGASELQIAKFLRGQQIIPYDRGNFQSNIHWLSNYVFNSYADSGNFVVTHATKLIGIGVLNISENGASWNLAKAKVTCRVSRFIGVNVLMEYNAIGGIPNAGT